MAVATSPIRKIENSLRWYVEQELKNAGWTTVTVLGEFPDAARTLPCVAIENNMVDRYPISLGTQRQGNDYGFVVHAFCKNDGQRKDLMYTMIGDDDQDGIFDHPLPVCEINGTATGTYLYPARMDVERADFITVAETPMDKYRGIVYLTISKK